MKKNHAYLWVAESFSTHDLNISYHDTFCLIKLEGNQSFFVLIALMKTLEYRNHIFLITIFQ